MQLWRKATQVTDIQAVYHVTVGQSTKEAQLQLPKLSGGTTYYVDAENGSDANSGTSPDQAWQTLEKVNSHVFYGDDQLLFKAGNTWTGKLWPKGSGVDGHPIRIGSYGEGAQPRFMPGEDDVHDYVTWVAGYSADVKTNQNFQLFNQSFWEISHLDFYDPKYEEIDPSTTDVMRRAVYILSLIHI